MAAAAFLQVAKAWRRREGRGKGGRRDAGKQQGENTSSLVAELPRMLDPREELYFNQGVLGPPRAERTEKLNPLKATQTSRLGTWSPKKLATKTQTSPPVSV